MEKFSFHVSYTRAGSRRSLVLLADALTDDEAIRAAHPLADFAAFEGGSTIEVSILGAGGRDVAVVSDCITDDDRHHVERLHRLGAGYRPQWG